MKYFTEIDSEGKIIQYKVCTDISEWTPRDGVRLVKDEPPEIDTFVQWLECEPQPILGDEIVYSVHNKWDTYPEYIKQDYNIVENFFKSRGDNRSFLHLYTTYDLLLGENISNIYTIDAVNGKEPNICVKVKDGVVSEYYLLNTIYKGESVHAISIDATTEEVMDVYRHHPNGLTKIPANSPDSTPKIVYIAPYYNMPPEIQTLLENFNHKERIFSFTDNGSGRLIVEYTEY
jgi:hypothetical protein